MSKEKQKLKEYQKIYLKKNTKKEKKSKYNNE